MEIIGFFGRFHPVILHLPIGMLVIAAILEMGNRGKGQKSMDLAITKILFWSAITALFSVIFGFCLQTEGGFEKDVLFWHRIFGILTFVFSLILYILKASGFVSTIYGIAWIITIINLILTGHLGSSLTHGSGYLLEYLPQGIRHSLGLPSTTESQDVQSNLSPANLEEALVYNDLIDPILKNKCGSCHNESKAKGDLSFHSIEALQKGGETGPVFIAGDGSKSLLSERIKLPVDHDDHMPPKGKRQLTKEEIILIDWWITQHKSFESKVKDYEKTDEVQAILNKRSKKINPVFSMDLGEINDDKIAKIYNKGIRLTRNARNNPYVEVSFSGQNDLSAASFKPLKPFAKQLISMDLSKSNVSNEMLKELQAYPNLMNLHLHNTQISDEGLLSLQSLRYLEYLNLYNTKISDKGLTSLQNLKHLTKLFVWETAVSDEGLRALQRELPELIIYTGMDPSEQFDSIQLKSPNIQADEEIFKDSLKITMRLNIRDAKIFYTIDGTLPDSTKLVYQGPFYIYKTTSLRCIAYKTAWIPSEVLSKSFVRQKYKAIGITLARQPNPRYKADGPNSLIDLKKGSVEFTDNLWLGFEGQPIEAVLDLGDTVSVTTITVGSIINNGSYLFPPRGLTAEYSLDGKRFKLAGARTSPAMTKAEVNQVVDYSLTFNPQMARYLRIKVASQMRNPRWHNAPGAPSWLFIDEILVE